MFFKMAANAQGQFCGTFFGRLSEWSSTNPEKFRPLIIFSRLGYDFELKLLGYYVICNNWFDLLFQYRQYSPIHFIVFYIENKQTEIQACIH
jgi:hypothetical protein